MTFQHNGCYPHAEDIEDRTSQSFWRSLREQRGSKVVAVSHTDGLTTETEIYHKNATLTTLLAVIGLVMVLVGLVACAIFYLR